MSQLEAICSLRVSWARSKCRNVGRPVNAFMQPLVVNANNSKSVQTTPNRKHNPSGGAGLAGELEGFAARVGGVILKISERPKGQPRPMRLTTCITRFARPSSIWDGPVLCTHSPLPARRRERWRTLSTIAQTRRRHCSKSRYPLPTR